MLLVKTEDIDGDFDDLFIEAIRVCNTDKSISTSALSRKLDIDHKRATKIRDQLEAAHIISTPDEFGVRKILISPDKKFGNNLSVSSDIDFIIANTKLIVTLFDSHNINIRPVKISVLNNRILFLFDFDITTKLDDFLSYDKEVATILASPTGEVEMGAPYKGTSLIYIYLPIKRKIKKEKYIVLDIEVGNITIDKAYRLRSGLKTLLINISDFLSELAHKI